MWKEDKKNEEYHDLKVEFELTQSPRFLTLPFVFIVRSKKKGLFVPNLELITTDSIKSIYCFKFILYDSSGSVLFSDSAQKEVLLNDFLDYRSVVSDFNREYKIKGLFEKSVGKKVFIDYGFDALYFDGRSVRFFFKQKILVQKRERAFGSFL